MDVFVEKMKTDLIMAWPYVVGVGRVTGLKEPDHYPRHMVGDWS